MLKHVSVRSSSPQVRSQPALRNLQPGFQKDVTSLLEHMQIPFPTFQLIKDTSQPVLEHQSFYGFLRPAHLRSSFLLLNESMPPVLINPREPKRRNTFRIPLARKKLSAIGPILCEVYWDTHEQILWVVDVLHWKQENVYSSQPFSERVKKISYLINEILYDTSGYSDSTVKIPKYYSMEHLAITPLEPEMAVEFQPENAGKRRFLFVQRLQTPLKKTENPIIHNNDKNVNKFKVMATTPSHTTCQIIDVEDDFIPKKHNVTRSVKQPAETSESLNMNSSQPLEGKQIMHIQKDSRSKLPDTYRLLQDGKDMGLAAIRNLTVSFALKELFRSQKEAPVEVQWYDAFKKYEVIGILDI